MNSTNFPRHIAIIMDGNGRWAKQRHLPRVAGHKAGFDAVREVVKGCVEKKIEALTLFAFSTENWQRPEQEVDYLMNLFITALQREAKKLHKQNIKLRIIGDRDRFDKKLRDQIIKAEQLTANNTGLNLVIAANYGGRWDIYHAMQKIAQEIERGTLRSQDISSDLIQRHLTLADLPEPDLFIRTSGEQRISNFLLWQIAYCELYFTNVLWPDFNIAELDKALDFYLNRERRFGFISEQLQVNEHA
ncbi:MAG: isoprenyl transferase [Gammaproteobacteria bacterium]